MNPQELGGDRIASFGAVANISFVFRDMLNLMPEFESATRLCQSSQTKHNESIHLVHVLSSSMHAIVKRRPKKVRDRKLPKKRPSKFLLYFRRSARLPDLTKKHKTY